MAVALLIVLVFSCALDANVAQGGSEVVWHVFGSGGFGGQASTIAVRSTLGQPVVGSATSSSYRVTSGFWLLAGNEPWSDVPEEEGDLPTVHRLGSCVPNPSSGSVTIHFSVAVGCEHVRLVVFDITGKQVTVLLDGQVAPGEKSLLWDGRSQDKHLAASGLYLIRMEAPGFSATRKVSVTR